MLIKHECDTAGPSVVTLLGPAQNSLICIYSSIIWLSNKESCCFTALLQLQKFTLILQVIFAQFDFYLVISLYQEINCWLMTRSCWALSFLLAPSSTGGGRKPEAARWMFAPLIIANKTECAEINDSVKDPSVSKLFGKTVRFFCQPPCQSLCCAHRLLRSHRLPIFHLRRRVKYLQCRGKRSTKSLCLII